MKKLIVCMSLAMALSAGVTALAADVTYDSENEQVTSDMAVGKSTVIIAKGTAVEDSEIHNIADEDVVYMDEAVSTFDAATNFLIKTAPADGEYTVYFGGDTIETKTFYIGLDDGQGDILMDKKGAPEEIAGGWGVAYTVTAPSYEYNTLLIKKGDVIMGCSLPTVMTGTGDAVLGVQINADTADELNAINEVYISTRKIAEGTTDTVEVQ